MRREEKYTDTDTFRFYNANPKGKYASDCVIRALCTAMEQTWEETYRGLVEVGIKYGLVINEKACFEKYLKAKGWTKNKQPRRVDGTKYTGKEFCKDYLRSADGKRRIIANIGGHHIVAIVDRKVYDIWDSTYKCIGNYWTR